MKSPVLLLIFNRPHLTQQVFETIRKAKPPRLYVAADGPRPGNSEDLEKVELTRKIATDVDWDCELHTMFRDENLGCADAVASAITWFFDQEEEGVILEDDVIVDSSWFPFADELLERYRQNNRIHCISALGYNLPLHDGSNYTFSIYNHCWGWASWRRAWQLYDHQMVKWPMLKSTAWLWKLGRYNPAFYIHWRNIFNNVYVGLINSWAYRWTFSSWLHGGLSIHPCANMVENIGFDDQATHTKEKIINIIDRVTPIKKPYAHPKDVKRNHRWDSYGCRYVFRINSKEAAKQLFKNLLRLSRS